MRQRALLFLPALLAAAMHLRPAAAPQPLPELLADLLGDKQWRPPVPDELEVKSFDAAEHQPPTCDAMPLEEMRLLFDEMPEPVNPVYKTKHDVIYTGDALFGRLQYCKDQRDADVYLNLRAAILGGVFNGSIPLLKVPQDTQAKCLRSLAAEEYHCGRLREQMCHYVEPLNAEAVEFGSQHYQEMAQTASQVNTAASVCLAMSAVVQDPKTLETAIEVEHEAKQVVGNGVASNYLHNLIYDASLRQATGAGARATAATGRRRYGRRRATGGL